MARQYHLPPRSQQPPSQDPAKAARPIPVLDDETPMPCGKHKGTKMKDISAYYFLTWWDMDTGIWIDGPHLHPNVRAVRNYIVANFKAIEMDAPDFNIKHHPDKMDAPKIKAIGKPTFK